MTNDLSADATLSLSDTLDQSEARLVQGSIAQVRKWLTTAASYKSSRSARLLANVLRDPEGLAFAVGFVDEVIRPEDVAVGAKALHRLAPKVPKFLPWWMRTATRLGGVTAPVAPIVVVPIARRVMRRLVGHLIIDARPQRLALSINRIKQTGAALNINVLGEAVLGSQEAKRRLARTEQMLARADVDYVSIKVSACLAPHNPWAFDDAVGAVVAQLRPLFTIAATSVNPKFINLDMEEYRDLDLTIAVFTTLLDDPAFTSLSAGIVLQAYLPDSLAAMKQLQYWSAARRARGGADVKVRVVKGANLPMEVVEAQVHGWPLATWHSKEESDAQYKRLLDYALTPERIANVRIGVAGHNLFDIAHSWLLANERGVVDGVEYEMLLGMAEGQAQAVRQTVGDLRLYTPVVAPEQFDVAIAYLVRRLEEGASSANFMSAVFDLATNEDLFTRECERFVRSIERMHEPVPDSHRGGDRYAAVGRPERGHFVNTPDTDSTPTSNRAWAKHVSRAAQESRAGADVLAQNVVTDLASLDQLLADAHVGGKRWGTEPAVARAAVLREVGGCLEANRSLLIEVAMSETGKTLDQADTEISEAVDFAYYYADLAEELDQIEGGQAISRPLTLVAPPWNFPIAIPAGSTMAALAAGSAVVLKPAPAAARCGAVLAELMWRAGIPHDVLVLVDISENELGEALVADRRISQTILTGAFETAALFRRFRPDLRLFAETSGKNAIIVTASADFDLAVKDIVASAFGHAGQKCSAASLLVLVGSVARSRRFREQLIDAVKSLNVGSEFALSTQLSRLIEPPGDKLMRGLTSLAEGETWLVEPRQVADDPRRWTPGVRAGVARGSEFHMTEYFGPILGVMTADDLSSAIELVNEVDYGLTSGIHALDETEIALWLDRVAAGNLYVNRGITGAIVQRQPFGGWKKSVVGPGAKAGGPNYLLGLVDWRPARSCSDRLALLPQIECLFERIGGLLSGPEREFLVRCASNDQREWQQTFSQLSDPSGLSVERNVLRYCPYPDPVVIRFGSDASLAALARVVAAATRTGASIVISSQRPLPQAVEAAMSGLGVATIVHDLRLWCDLIASPTFTRVRAVGVESVVTDAAGRVDLAIWDHEVTESGRLEMLPFLREQSISITAHRFGSPRAVPH